MLKRLALAVVFPAALLCHAAPVQAQTDHAHVGFHALYNTTFQDAGVGAQFSLPVARHLEFYPSVDLYFQTGATVWQPNFDFKYRALGQRNDWFYLGTGLGLLQESVDGLNESRAMWNLFIGAENLHGEIHPFIEARAGVSDENQFQIQGGINITIGHH